MRKHAFLLNKGADQLCGTIQLISTFVFTIKIHVVQCLYFLYPKFQASSQLLWPYSQVCVRPGRNPQDRFSLEEAQMKDLIKVKHLT